MKHFADQHVFVYEVLTMIGTRHKNGDKKVVMISITSRHSIESKRETAFSPHDSILPLGFG